jgi:hypothetical protein
MRTYRGDLIELRTWLERRRPFALVRFGDGELRILNGQSNSHPEFEYDPTDPAHNFFRVRLFEAFRYQSLSYHVGISCPNCVGMERFLWAKRESGQPETQLTWATLLVNSNYQYFIDYIVPVFAQYRIVMVCHLSAVLNRLPFDVAQDFRVGFNAWQADYHLAGQLADQIARENIQGALFLLCAGPFANILAHKLHARAAGNTYLDIGSTLDPFLFGPRGRTRRYLRGESCRLDEVCIWA